MVLHLVHVPSVRSDDLSVRERFRRGRERLYDLTLSELEERVRDELTRTRVGHLAFASANAAWEPFAHVAIEQGHRARRSSSVEPAR
jgi:hypothetical protein